MAITLKGISHYHFPSVPWFPKLKFITSSFTHHVFGFYGLAYYSNHTVYINKVCPYKFVAFIHELIHHYIYLIAYVFQLSGMSRNKIDRVFEIIFVPIGWPILLFIWVIALKRQEGLSWGDIIKNILFIFKSHKEQYT